MSAAKWKLFIDDTGMVGDGAYEEIVAAINSPIGMETNTITVPVCVGDVAEMEEAIVPKYQITGQIKVKKGDAIQLRILNAFKNKSQWGFKATTGDVTAAGALAGGHITLTMNALVKQFNVAMAVGSTLVYDIVLVNHSDNAADEQPTVIHSADGA
jgi:hypothetical protein